MKFIITVIVLLTASSIGWAYLSSSDGEYTCETGIEASYQRVPGKLIVKVSGNSFLADIHDGTKLAWQEAKEENSKVLPNAIQQPDLLGKQFLVYGGRAGGGSICTKQ